MAKSDLTPQGESFRAAIRWISARRLEEPTSSVGKFIDEAALRFDLSPLEVESLRAQLLSERK